MAESKLFVGNLSFKVTEDDLTNLFGEYGNVTRATIVTDRDSGRSRGFGFVEMSSDSEAKAAIDALNGAEMQGREIQVNTARPREDRGGRSGGFGGGGDRGFGGGGGRRESRW